MSAISCTLSEMRRVRYSVAMSLDGYIAGPHGEFEWIPHDPEIDFTELFSQFDTLLIGRRTFDVMLSAGRASTPGMKTIVFSTTLRQADHPEVMIVAENPREVVSALKAQPGKDIWLFGGGLLFRSLAEERLVDTVEVAIMPVLLGVGIPLFPDPAHPIKLSLTAQKIYRTGIVSLQYTIRQ
jgi:dihydrofolate reductase